MALTKKEFLKKYASNPLLAKEVLNQMSMDWKDIISRPEDYRNAGSGVPGFIYYSSTVPFAEKNYRLIIRALHKFQNETGDSLKIPSETETEYYNCLSWFALENTIDDIMMYKENKTSH